MNYQGKVKAVVIEAPSYCGSTWVNAVLASHPDCFYIGASEKLWNARLGEWQEICQIHKANCSFWPKFFESYKPEENFFIQLALFSGKTVMVLNNPNAEVKNELAHPCIEIYPISLVRDPRAMVSSRMRHYDELDPVTTIIQWIYPVIGRIQFDPEVTSFPNLHYEDVVADQYRFLSMMRDYLGIGYDERALRFWEWDHHITSGNRGTIAQMKLGQGMALNDFPGRVFYENQFEQLCQSVGQPQFDDQRWKKHLSRRNLFLYDLLCWEHHVRLGYERDTFSQQEFVQYILELREAAQLEPEAFKPVVSALSRFNELVPRKSPLQWIRDAVLAR